MALFLQLAFASAPALLHPELDQGLLQAFFCIEGDCVHGRHEGDPFAPNHLLRIVSGADDGRAVAAPGGTNAASAIPARMIVGWDAADDFPSMTDAENLLGIRTETKYIDKADRDVLTCDDPPLRIVGKLHESFDLPWALGGEKFGGWAGWGNVASAYPKCPKCGRTMDLMVFQIGFEGFIPVMFGDGGQGHIVCCPDHPLELA